MTIDDLYPGDVVIIGWRDHYRTHEMRPVSAPMLAESYGRVIEVNDAGVALDQNRVLNADVIDAEESMDAQFILRECITAVVRLTEEQTD